MQREQAHFCKIQPIQRDYKIMHSIRCIQKIIVWNVEMYNLLWALAFTTSCMRFTFAKRLNISTERFERRSTTKPLWKPQKSKKPVRTFQVPQPNVAFAAAAGTFYGNNHFQPNVANENKKDHEIYRILIQFTLCVSNVNRTYSRMQCTRHIACDFSLERQKGLHTGRFMIQSRQFTLREVKKILMRF